MAANAIDLCTTATVATDLGIASSDALQRVVTGASRAIAKYCGRTFEKGSALVEYPRGDGRPLLLLKRAPVVSITSIYEGTALVPSTEYESVGDNAEAGMVLHKTRSWLSTKRVNRLITEVEVGNPGQSDQIVVTYTGGYVTPGQKALDDALTVTLPEDIQEAAIMSVVAIFRGRGADQNIKSEAIGDWSVSFFDTKATAENVLPAQARGLLAPYVRF